MQALFGSLRNRLVLLFGASILLIGLPTYLYIDNVYTQRALAEKGARLSGLATAVAAVLAEDLRERQREITLLAESPLLTRGALDGEAFASVLDRLKRSYPHYSWIGLADRDGTVRVATGGLLVGVSVAQRPWFINGLNGPFVGDLHEAVLLSRHLPPRPDGAAIRFIDFTAPVRGADGALRGVLAAHAHWDWVEEVVAAIWPQWTQGAGVELLLVNREGLVIHSAGAAEPSEVASGLVADGAFTVDAWPDGMRYGMAAAAVRDPLPGQTLSWRVVVRQPVARMLADVETLKRTLIAFKLVAAGALMALIWWGASRMSRPIEELARFSRRVEEGDPHAGLALGDGRGEVAEVQALSRAVRGMARTLIENGQALERSNQALEQKVAERTRELERLRLEAELQARTDPLTSLPNRRAFYEGAGKLLRLASRSGDPLALLMLDIDHFKRVNDTWGHDVGDLVLIEVAAQIAGCARDSDLPVRLGGEEFAVLLPGTDATGAQRFAERLRQKIAALEIVVDDEVLQVTSSFGIACSAGAQTDIEDLLQRSDAALYRAKAEGRNRVTVAGEVLFSA